MPVRPAELQHFLDNLRDAIFARTARGEAARCTTERIFAHLERPGAVFDRQPRRLPVCRCLDEALASASAASADLAVVARAFAALEPGLTWYRRAGSDAVGEPFHSAHGNVLVVGPDGTEEREDVWIGCSLVGPHIRYPDHHHPPGEVYLVLSAGEWRQRRQPWWTPGAGGIVHNPPDIPHAMRSGSEPLFAIWCLLVDGGVQGAR